VRFASAHSLGFPVLRASTTMTPFVRFLPLRTDREHDPSKGRFLAAPVGHAGAWSIPRRTNRRGSQVTFVTRANDGSTPSLRFSFADVPCGAPTRARARAVRPTTPPLLRAACIVCTGREHRVEEPSPPGGGGRREPRLDTVSSISWSPIARAGVWRALPRHDQPKTRPTFRAPRRETNVRAHRDAFHRPSLVRAREDCSSACSSGTRRAVPRLTEGRVAAGLSAPL